ncbi:MAG: hypothetical protein U1E10_07365 [Bdellovibrionales bacterium]|nr:hypothetical protein [Bdellovibrionales bacterium]
MPNTKAKVPKLLGLAALFLLLPLIYNNCGQVAPVEDESTSLDSSSGLSPESAAGGEEFWESAQLGPARAMSGATQSQTTANCQVTGDFPLRTHFRKGVGPAPGGTDLPQLLNTSLSSEVAARQPFVRIYRDYVPRPGMYLEDNFDGNVYPDQDIRAVLGSLCSATVPLVRFRQVSSAITTMDDIRNLIIPNERSFQVLHGLVFKKNLFTVVVPPMWTAGGSRSSLFSNGYSLHGQLMNSNLFFRELNRAYQLDQKGAIGVMWNGGGAQGTYTVHDTAYSEFNDFLRILVPAVGLNADKAIAMGGSRAGWTAINMAAHPLVTSLRFAHVYSVFPPADWDAASRSVSTTIPFLLTVIDSAAGYVGAWRNGFRSPELGLSGSDALIFTQTGTSNRSVLRQNHSLFSTLRTDKIKRGNTSILLAISSHDFIVPSVGQWDLAKAYLDTGMNVEIEKHYFCGHGSCKMPDHDLAAAIVQLNASATPRTERLVTPRRVSHFMVNATTGVSEPITRAGNLDPLTVEFPRFILDDVEGPVFATGVPGRRYAVALKDSLGQDFGFIMVLSASGTARYNWAANQVPDGVIRLGGIFEVNSADEPVTKIAFISNLKDNPPIEFLRYREDTRDLGTGVALAITKSFVGNNLERAYVDPKAGVAFLMNYGVLETGTLPVSAADIALVRRISGRLTPTPTATPAPTATPSPTPIPNVCGASTAPLQFASPDGSNVCSVEWPQRSVGQSIKSIARSTNGGASGELNGTCTATNTWSFSYLCPNKTGSTCGGGQTVLPSIPSGARACTFKWDQASGGANARILSSAAELNGGVIDGKCETTGWAFSYACADPGVKACTGGGAFLPSASGGNGCHFAWPHTVGGRSFSGSSDAAAGNGAGRLTADCVVEGTAAVWKNVVAVCP